MKKRQIIILASTLLILIVGYGGCSILAGMKKAPERKAPQKTFRLVKVMEVKNDTLVKLIAVQGKLIAKEKVEIFPEVTGRLLSTNKPFKLGQKFSKGEVLLSIDGNESMLNLKSQRSSFISALSQVLPDIKIDYPDSFDAWKAFSDNLNPNELLPVLPELSDSKLKSFLSGRNVFQQYYAIRSLEDRQSKFTITAPFDGSVSSGIVNAGTVLRAGQKVGEFTKDGVYEFEAAIPGKDAVDIEVGDFVNLTVDGSMKSFKGKIIRIASSLDPNNQRISLYAELKGDALKEGLYLEGTIEAAQINNAISVNHNLVIDDEYVYLVQDTILVKKQVEIKDKFKENALITGLQEGDLLLNQVIQGAYEGMLVKTESK
jgi:membrane fusion protein, multidrug efflux system